jgi:iron complex outermembrane recepter protein
MDVSFVAKLGDRITLSGSYAYVNAELSELAPDLIRTIVPGGGFDVDFENGLPGDRLPGSPEHQGNLFATYDLPMSNGMDWAFNYGVTVTGDVVTRAGSRGNGEALGGFSLHSASAVLTASDWTFALYAKNLFNKYAETGVRTTRAYIQTVTDENGDPVRVRSYTKDVARPRELGLRVTYNFKL